VKKLIGVLVSNAGPALAGVPMKAAREMHNASHNQCRFPQRAEEGFLALRSANLQPRLHITTPQYSFPPSSQ
jgi:hypothetical protein